MSRWGKEEEEKKTCIHHGFVRTDWKKKYILKAPFDQFVVVPFDSITSRTDVAFDFRGRNFFYRNLPAINYLLCGPGQNWNGDPSFCLHIQTYSGTIVINAVPLPSVPVLISETEEQMILLSIKRERNWIGIWYPLVTFYIDRMDPTLFVVYIIKNQKGVRLLGL